MAANPAKTTAPSTARKQSSIRTARGDEYVIVLEQVIHLDIEVRSKLGGNLKTTVRMVHEKNGQKYEGTTSDKGVGRIANVVCGPYRVEAKTIGRTAAKPMRVQISPANPRLVIGS